MKGEMDMPKQDPMDALKRDPQAAQLLGDPVALKSLLQSQEAKTLAGLLQQMGGAGLQQAAQAATRGDASALSAILQKVQADPQGAKAMDSISKKTSK